MIQGGHVRRHPLAREACADAFATELPQLTARGGIGDQVADQKLRSGLDDWCVDESWFANTREDCRFMHCLPVRRGVVVADEVLDGPRSVVIHEAQNRMYAQMAVLHQMMLG